MNNWVDGLRRAPLHMLGFGVPFGILALWFPWYSVIGVLGFRLGQEYYDVQEQRDTVMKAILDVLSSVVIPIVVAYARK